MEKITDYNNKYNYIESIHTYNFSNYEQLTDNIPEKYKTLYKTLYGANRMIDIVKLKRMLFFHRYMVVEILTKENKIYDPLYILYNSKYNKNNKQVDKKYCDIFGIDGEIMIPYGLEGDIEHFGLCFLNISETM